MADQGPIFSIRGLGTVDQLGKDELTDLVRQVEDAGFDMVWAGNDFLEAGGLVSLTVMLMATERLTVGSGVLEPVTIHAGQIAQYASALQTLSGGRFVLGLGAGSEVLFRRASIPFDRPVPRTREALVAIRALTRGEDLSLLTDAGGPWSPVARLDHPHEVPIYIGAMGPKMLELAGRRADGVLSLSLPPSYVFEVMKHVKAGADKAGRDTSEIDVVAGLWCGVSSEPDEARAMLRHHIAITSGALSTDALLASGLDPEEFAHVQSLVDADRLDDAIAAVTPSMMTLGVVGGPADIIDQCGQLLESGVRHLSFGTPLAPDKREAIHLLGTEVLPELRRAFA